MEIRYNIMFQLEANQVRDMSFAIRCTYFKSCKIDQLAFLYGAKIDDQWFFFRGPSVALPREYYQEDIHKPLSFEKLHELAMENVFAGYLKQGSNGEWQINERFFDRMIIKNRTAGGFGECFQCKSEDEYVLYMVEDNWRRRTSNTSAEGAVLP